MADRKDIETITLGPEERSMHGDTDPKSQINVALQTANYLANDAGYADPEFINLMTGLSFAPKFHELLDEMVAGKLLVRDFAALCYLAGRLSIAISPHP